MPVWDFGQDQERKEPQPPWQQAHGVARGAEDRVDCVAVRAGEVVSVQQALVLHLAHHGPDPVSASHLAADRWRGDPARLAQRDIKAVALDPVATVAAIHTGAFNGCTGEFADLLQVSLNRRHP